MSQREEKFIFSLLVIGIDQNKEGCYPSVYVTERGVTSEKKEEKNEK